MSTRSPKSLLALNVVRDLFGDLSHRVAEILLRRGRSSLREVVHTLERELSQRAGGVSFDADDKANSLEDMVLDSLLGLVHHGLARFAAPSEDEWNKIAHLHVSRGSADGSAANPRLPPPLYTLDVDRAVLCLRYPRFLLYVRSQLGEDASDALLEVFARGRSVESQVVDAFVKRKLDPAAGGAAPAASDLRARAVRAFTSLKARQFITVAAPKALNAPTPVPDADFPTMPSDARRALREANQTLKMAASGSGGPAPGVGSAGGSDRKTAGSSSSNLTVRKKRSFEKAYGDNGRAADAAAAVVLGRAEPAERPERAEKEKPPKRRRVLSRAPGRGRGRGRDRGGGVGSRGVGGGVKGEVGSKGGGNGVKGEAGAPKEVTLPPPPPHPHPTPTPRTRPSGSRTSTSCTATSATNSAWTSRGCACPPPAGAWSARCSSGPPGTRGAPRAPRPP